MAVYSITQRAELLARAPLFESLSESDVEAIANVTTTRSLKAREELFHKGDDGAQIYLVASGQLKVITTSSEGDDLMFCVLDPGEVIGEVGLLADLPRTATVAAIAKSELLVVDRRDFRALLHNRPAVAVQLLSTLSRRLARVSAFVEDTHFYNLPVRLAKKLCDFMVAHGVDAPGKPGAKLIDIKLSQEEWGDLVGTTRESVNKQFGTWSKEGLIETDKGRVVALDVQALEDLADCVVI